MNLIRRLVIAAWLLLGAAVAAAQVTLIPAGSVWKYLDNGSNAGTAWRGTSYSDAAWAQGAAKLGFGDGDEVTIVSYGPNASSKYVTTYFRRAFTVADASALSGLNLRARRDDGIVVYLNGTEIWRDNMPSGTVSYTTLASDAAPDDGATWQSVSLATTGLVTGANVLAVEIHQSSLTSSDLTFDLELKGSTSTSGASLTRGPYLQIGTPSSIVVRWRTDTATNSVVRYGASSSALTSTASDATATTEHSVTLSGLSADTRYYYSIGSSSATLAGGSNDYYFVTAPAANSQRATRVWVIGDAGTGNSAQAQVRDAYASFTGSTHTDLWLQLGDNAYDSGTDSEYQSTFFGVYGDMLRHSVTWPTIGNHDTAQSTSPPSSLPYFQNFSFPTAAQAGGVASGTRNYYSFDFGNIHFVCLDSMASSRSAGSPMLTWLQYDLAANTKDWVVAYWHHPPYSKGSHDSDVDTESTEMRQNVLPILESFGVDLVLSGHSHTYERSYLIDGHYGLSSTFTNAMKKNGGGGRPAETGAYTKPLGMSSHQGAVYAVAGASGHTESGGSLDHPAMFISLLRLGSVVLDVNGQRMDVRYLSETGAALDTFSIVKGATTNQPPTVSLTSPASGSTYAAPATVSLAASAADSDGSVQRVEFYQGGTLLGTSTAAPYSFAWNGVTQGSYALTARAYDNLGASTTSAPVPITVATSGGTTTSLIDVHSVWKYLDNGSDQGSAWRFVGFNDTLWASGPAQLGYGDGDEATVVSYGSSASKKYITTYFRRLFTVDDASQYTGLVLRLLRDDGAVVYLNGTEIVRSNMPSGTITSSTLASSAVSGSDESTFYEYAIGTQLLAGGTNVIAVEIHQSSADSSDISFDLELLGQRPAGNAPPSVSETAPASGSVYTAPASITLTASAGDSDGTIQRVEFYQGATLLGTATASPYSYAWVNVPAGNYSITAKAFDNNGASSTSTPVAVTVLPAGSSGGGAVRYVRLQADSEINGNAWTSMAEFNVLDANGAALPRTGWSVAADSAELSGEYAPATNAVDGSASTFWHTQWSGANPPPPHTYTVDMGVSQVVGGFKYLPRPGGGNGTIAAWRFFTSANGTAWTQVAQGTFASSADEKTIYPIAGTGVNQSPSLTAISNQSSVVGKSASLAMTGSDPDGDTLTYSATGLPTGLTLNASAGIVSGTPTATGTFNVTATASDGRGGSASRSFVWTISSAGAGAVQYVRLQADSEINGNAWTSMAEFNLLDSGGALISRSGWTATADSVELSGEYAPASNAIDGDTSTFWHTQWFAASPQPPHAYTVNLGTPRVIGGFKYLPRPGGGNGTIAAWRFFTSVDGVTWTQVSQGTFANDAAEKTVMFP